MTWRPFFVLLTGACLALATANCTGGVDTKSAAGDDDDDATGDDDDDGASPNPSPSPTNPGVTGDPWTTTATPIEQGCGLAPLFVHYGDASGVAVIGVGTTGTILAFDIGLNNPSIGIGEAPNGTLQANGDFVQDFSYCLYNGLSTMKYYGNWTGTMTPDGVNPTAFDNSSLLYYIDARNGDYRSQCATATFDPVVGSCSTSGVTFSIDGVKQ